LRRAQIIQKHSSLIDQFKTKILLIILLIAVIPHEEDSVFSVISNSTISALSFNSESRELSFTVTGPSETFGYVDVLIAKNLVSNVAETKIYLNGTAIEYTISQLEDSWLFHFTYSHSSHNIIINLKGTLSFFGLSPMDLAIIGIVIAVICVIAVFLVLSRKRVKKA
jgi:hypothetical protein